MLSLPGSMAMMEAAAAAAAAVAAAGSGMRLDTEIGSDEVEDMDTSEPDWAWFYLAECGQWHMFGVRDFLTLFVVDMQVEFVKETKKKVSLTERTDFATSSNLTLPL